MEKLKLTKSYQFYDESYYYSNACDCCQGGWINSFNSDQVNGNFGSAFSEEDCYLQAIATEMGYEYWEDFPDTYRLMDYAELKKVADLLGIKVEIVS